MSTQSNSVLNADATIEEAVRLSGCDDFGTKDWLPPLQLLLKSLREEANLHEAGQAAMHERNVKLLVNRLRIQDYLKKYPEISQEEIKSPIFIAAFTRTGTTMLQRFLASDQRNYAVLWYECRNPAPLDTGFSGTKDERIALAEQEVAFMLENYPGLGAIHPMEATAPDECIMLLEHTFCSGMPLAMANVPSYNEWEHSVDHTDAYTYYKSVLQFLQWQKKRKGERAERWVLKAPEHLGHIDIIFKLFPDAVIIQSHREPMYTIPSISSMIYSGWAAYADNPDKHLIGRYWAKRLQDFSDHCMLAQSKMPSDRFVNVWYEDLLKNPMQQAQEIYAHVGLSLGDAARQAMDEWQKANKREKRAKHEYSMEEYGFSKESLDSQFSNYRTQYIEGR